MSMNKATRPCVAALRREIENASVVWNRPGSFWRSAVLAFWTAIVLFSLAAPSWAQSTIPMNKYALPQAQSNPWSLTAGPDGAVWFTVSCESFYCGTNTGDAIGRITSSGVITEFPLPASSLGSSPYGITTGPDGALWFTELQGNKIGRATTAGVITEYSLPTPNAFPYEIVTGPDGALWFTEMRAGKIGRITTDGVITEHCAEGIGCGTDPTDIVTGPDGAMWYTNLNSNWIGRMTMQEQVTKYPLPVFSADYGIVAGPDNALWFTGGIGTTAVIWRIGTDGVFSSYNVPTQNAGLSYITLGSDNALWFTENMSGQIGRVTTAGVFTEYPVGGTYSTGPVAIAKGPDNAVWFGQLGYITQIPLADTTAPRITLSVTPKMLWPPNGQMVTVKVSGNITDTGSGIAGGSVEYAVTDEYRLIQPTGHLTLDAAGNYSFSILLRASREGNDLDGRQYMLRVSARDNAGNRGANWQVITVPYQR